MPTEKMDDDDPQKAGENVAQSGLRSGQSDWGSTQGPNCAIPTKVRKSAAFFEPEIDHFVMAITAAEAEIWHRP
jgi:hypothetical protein